MSDFEKIVGGTIQPKKPESYILRYRNKAGKDHVIEMIENTSNDMLGMTIKDIRDRMRGVGEILSEDEMILEDVTGGHYEKPSVKRKMLANSALRNAYDIFTNGFGTFEIRKRELADIDAIISDILSSSSMHDKDELLLASILVSDDELDLPNLVQKWKKK